MTTIIDRTLSALPADSTRAVIYAALRAVGVAPAFAKRAGARFDEIQQLRHLREALKPAPALGLAERAEAWLSHGRWAGSRGALPWPYRTCEGAGASSNTFDLRRGATPRATSRSTKAWGKGLPSSYRYPVSSSHVEVTVSMTWIADVFRRGLASVDGLTTLAAELELHREYPDCEFYRATWVEQGRGVEVRVEHGFIVRQGTWTHHAKTLSGAKRAVRDRESRERDTALRYAARSLSGAWAGVERLGLEEHRVTLEASKRAGNCEAGTRDWVARHLPGRTEASLREVYEAARASGDRPEYVAKVLALVAVRAARRAA